MTNKKWECFLCSQEDDFKILPSGYLSNYHPLCNDCADTVLKNEDHKHRFRLTFHKDIGDVILSSNILINAGHFMKN